VLWSRCEEVLLPRPSTTTVISPGPFLDAIVGNIATPGAELQSRSVAGGREETEDCVPSDNGGGGAGAGIGDAVAGVLDWANCTRAAEAGGVFNLLLSSVTGSSHITAFWGSATAYRSGFRRWLPVFEKEGTLRGIPDWGPSSSGRSQ